MAGAVADIRSTYGAAFIGLLVSTILFGVTITQTWIYYWHYRNKDPRLLKIFVALLFVLDSLHTILCIYSIYWYLILNFGNVESLDFNMWAMNSQADINGLVGFSVQLFYARRLYIMSRSVIFPTIITVLGSVCFSLGFVFTARAFALERFSRYGSLIWVTCAGMGSASLADILIALSMCWCLYHKKTGFAKTDSMIMTLMSYSLNSGLLTSVLATATLICFVVVPTTLIWQAFFWPLGKCYVNSLLAMLNNRDVLRERSANSNSDSSFGMTSLHIARQSEIRQSKRSPATVSVTMHRSGVTDYSQAKQDYKGEPAIGLGLKKSLDGFTPSSDRDDRPSDWSV